MAPKILPPAEVLRKLLRYDPETGLLTWLPRPVESFKSRRAFAIWERRFVGKLALNSLMANGYRHGAINYETFLAHRVIWKLVTGVEPEEIDHINGDRSDNRWLNIRNGSRNDNMRNRGISSNNTSGVMGVMWQPGFARWEAFIDANGKRKYIGRYRHIEDAIAARLKAERALGYHPNHGRRPCYSSG